MCVNIYFDEFGHILDYPTDIHESILYLIFTKKFGKKRCQNCLSLLSYKRVTSNKNSNKITPSGFKINYKIIKL